MIKGVMKRVCIFLLTAVLVISILPGAAITALAAQGGLDDDRIGLSSAGDGTWQAEGTSISGETGTKCGSSGASESATLTLTNNAGGKAILSFRYTITNHAGSVSIDGETKMGAGTFTKELDAGGSVTVVLDAKGSQSANATSIEITNIRLVELAAQATVTFEIPENGTVTVGGELLTAKAQFNSKTAEEGYAAVATPSDGYRFLGWLIDGKLFSREASTTLHFDSDTTVTAKFIPMDGGAFDVGGAVYYDYDEAVRAAKEGETVALLVDWTADHSLTVPKGITLLIPCMEGDVGYKSGGHSPDGTTADGAGPNAALYRTLTVPAGTDITVEGTLLVNAVTGRSAEGPYDQDVNGGCGQIILDGRILVKDGGALDVNGYIRGGGSIDAAPGGAVCDLYVIPHWRGSSAAYGARRENIFPMNESRMHNIEVPLTVQAGGTLSGTVKMFSGGSYECALFPQVDSAEGLFRQSAEGGFMTKTYDSGREKLTFHGDGRILSGTLVIDGADISTKDFIYPFDGDMDLSFDGSWTIGERLKFMPGATVTLESGSSLTVPAQTADAETDNLVVFYDAAFTDPYKSDPSKAVYPSGRGDAVLIMKAGTTLTADGAFAGRIRIDESATEASPATVVMNGSVSVTTQEVERITGESALAAAAAKSFTFTADIDGYELASGKTYICWKDGGTTVIRAEDGTEVRETVYDGTNQVWTGTDGVLEYRIDGKWTTSGPVNVGTYAVRKVTAADEGYKAVEVLGELTVKPLTAEFALAESSFTYKNGEAHTVTAQVTNAREGDSLTVTLGGDITGTDAGQYTAFVTGITGEGAGNYTTEGSQTTGLFWTIEKAEAPHIAFPTVTEEVTYDPDKTLSDIKLDGGSTEYGSFKWTNPETVPTVAVRSYEVTFTPNAQTARNYAVSEQTRMIDVTVNKGAQAAPSSLTPHHPATVNGTGSISGVDETMEYREKDGGAWTAVTGDTIAGLAPGTYLVRYQESENRNAGECAEVTIHEFVPGQADRPSAEIDFGAEELTGLAPGEYKINGQNVTVDGHGVPIDPDWFGTTVTIVKKGDEKTTLDSVPQNLPIPARPAAPSGLEGGYTSGPGAADGKVTGLTDGAAYEYEANGGDWTELTADTTLAAGTYRVRLAATNSAFHSEAVQVEVKDPNPEKTPEIAIDYQREKLTNFAEARYTVNGQEITVKDGTVEIDEDWFGTTVTVIKKGDGKTTLDSAPQNLPIPARPATPEVSIRRTSRAGQSDGALTVTDPVEGKTYEYRQGTGGQWRPMDGAKAGGLSEDTYYVRVKAGTDSFAGNAAAAVVSHKEEQTMPRLTVTQPAAIGQKGSVTGLTTAMEWSKEEDGSYTLFTEDKIAELTKVEGSLHIWVRLAETETLAHSAAVEVTVTAFVPETMVTPTDITIDYANEKLTCLTEGVYKVTVGGQDSAVAVTGTAYAIREDWFGREITLIKTGDGITSVDGDAVTVPIPARPAAPSGLEGGYTSGPSAADGKVTGLTDGAAYEYDANGDKWTELTADTVLAAGTYRVRLAATDSSFHSEAVQVEVKDPEPEKTPNIAIDYHSEKLTNFAEARYTVNGQEITVEDGTVEINEDWFGTTVTIIKKGDGSTTLDSAPQNLPIPAHPAAPSGLEGGYTSGPGATDGKVTGLTDGAAYEYEANGAWEPITGTTALAAGTYTIRRAATDSTFHSEAVQVEVKDPKPEKTPNIAIDYQREKLTNFAQTRYTVNGQEITVKDGTVEINEDWFGTTVTIIKKGDGSTTLDSAPQSLTIPARPAAPEGLTAGQTTGSGRSDGSITGLDETVAYEYRAANGPWTDAETGSTTIEGLAAGKYEVRVKATEGAFASAGARVSVTDYVVPQIPGRRTETVINPDGSITTTTTEPDGTKTETTRYADGTVTEKVTRPDGSAVETTTTPDGVTGRVFTDAEGEITSAEVVIPEDAGKDGVVTAPVEVPVEKNADGAPEIDVKTGSGESARVEIPAAGFGPGTVAVVIHEDGTEEVVRDCVIGENGVVLNVRGDVTIKLVDNTRLFKDVQPVGHWASKEVVFVAARQLFNGTDADVFEPDAEMTRGMLVTVLHRLAYEPDAEKQSFNDVDTEAYYAEAVAWAAGIGAVYGVEDNAFAPEDGITREDLVLILYRCARRMGFPTAFTGACESFADAAVVSDYAREAMDWAVSVGLICGRENNRLAPTETATRAEAAAIFMRFCTNVIGH